MNFRGFGAERVPDPQREWFQLQREGELGICSCVSAAPALCRLLLPRDAINRWAVDLTASLDVIRKPIGTAAECLVAVCFMVLTSIMRDRRATGTITCFPEEDSGVRQSGPRWLSALTLKAIIHYLNPTHSPMAVSQASPCFIPVCSCID